MRQTNKQKLHRQMQTLTDGQRKRIEKIVQQTRRKQGRNGRMEKCQQKERKNRRSQQMEERQKCRN